MSSELSLRERQRLETRRHIHDAVMELSGELGFENVTTEAISVRAGVSPRTFFNYFASKEAAVIAEPPVQLRGEHAEKFAAGPVRRPRELLVELTRLMLDQLAEDPPDRASAEAIFGLATGSPAVFAAMVAQVDTVRRDLAEVLEQRLPESADPQLADLIASLAMAAVRSGLEAWAADVTKTGEATPVAHVRHAVDLIESIASETDVT